jgi:endonuclease/exonuclease/phosphatase family metal-dependent hydrolase
MTYQMARTAEFTFDSGDDQAPPGPTLASEPDPRQGKRDLLPGPCEFHRRRAEMEMERALAAGQLSIAVRHLELARLHRERRAELGRSVAAPNRARSCPIDRTDKEG